MKQRTAWVWAVPWTLSRNPSTARRGVRRTEAAQNSKAEGHSSFPDAFWVPAPLSACPSPVSWGSKRRDEGTSAAGRELEHRGCSFGRRRAGTTGALDPAGLLGGAELLPCNLHPHLFLEKRVNSFCHMQAWVDELFHWKRTGQVVCHRHKQAAATLEDDELGVLFRTHMDFNELRHLLFVSQGCGRWICGLSAMP